MTTIDRINTLHEETTKALLESSTAAQKQHTNFMNQWLGHVETRQKANEDLLFTVAKQTQEAQKLWLQLWQETYSKNVDAATRLGETQLREAGSHMETLKRQANGATKKAAPAAK